MVVPNHAVSIRRYVEGDSDACKELEKSAPQKGNKFVKFFVVPPPPLLFPLLHHAFPSLLHPISHSLKDAYMEHYVVCSLAFTRFVVGFQKAEHTTPPLSLAFAGF
jgi:hypothetical protein